MSVVAWDGKMLAADKIVISGGLIGITTKIFRSRDHLVGFAGNLSMSNELLDWFGAGAIPKDFPAAQRTEADSVEMMVITPYGQIWRFDRTPYPVIHQGLHCAIGSGMDVAMAVMHLGHSAALAVEVASKLISTCGQGVDILHLTR